jgi:hypothetical protein
MKIVWASGIIAFLVAIIFVLLFTRTSVPQEIIVQAPSIPDTILTAPIREPEFRRPPIRQYRPDTYKQVGVLVGQDADEIRPLYGRPSYAYNNRWNYYTTTIGNQVYPLPISNGDRNCTEDIGCDELYGNEDLTILGKTGTFKPTIYRISPMVDL